MFSTVTGCSHLFKNVYGAALLWAVEVHTVVLCLHSAGVGRTGVFITLSIVLERMRYEGVVDLFQTVKTLRTQRPAMVQTEVRTRSHCCAAAVVEVQRPSVSAAAPVDLLV